MRTTPPDAAHLHAADRGAAGPPSAAASLHLPHRRRLELLFAERASVARLPADILEGADLVRCDDSSAARSSPVCATSCARPHRPRGMGGRRTCRACRWSEQHWVRGAHLHVAVWRRGACGVGAHPRPGRAPTLTHGLTPAHRSSPRGCEVHPVGACPARRRRVTPAGGRSQPGSASGTAPDGADEGTRRLRTGGPAWAHGSASARVAPACSGRPGVHAPRALCAAGAGGGCPHAGGRRRGDAGARSVRRSPRASGR